MILKKITGMVLSPLQTLQNVYNEPVMDTLVMLAVVSVITFATSVLVNLNYVAEFYIIGINWISSILMIFVMAGLFHIFLMILRKNTLLEHYFKTLIVVVYASVVFALFGWIPYIGFVVSIWFIYLIAKGLALYYDIKLVKSFAVVLLPYIVLILLSFIQ